MTRLALVFLILAAAGAGSDALRPACNAGLRGRFYPEKANADADHARRSAQCGELWICTKGAWRHRWERLSVHISQLGGNARSTAPGCEEFAVDVVQKPADKHPATPVE